MSSTDNGRPPDGAPVTIALAGAQFGWGSVGKLAAVVDSLRARHGDHLRFVGLDSVLGRPVLEGHAVTAWLDAPEDDEGLTALLAAHGVAAAIVVLDTTLAGRLESAGCPVVYVDSLPFLWTEADHVPTEVSAYCAQLCPSLPQASWPVLRRVRSLHWVGPVVGTAPSGAARPVPGRAVLNVGGLDSPFRDPDDDSYLRLVLSPALNALRETGFGEVVITGNVDIDRLPLAPGAARGLALSGGRLTRGDFVAAQRAAELVVTSPGRTTLLETASLNQRCVLLPPQNISQVLNAADVAVQVAPGIVVGWPERVLDLTEVEKRKALGEGEAVEFVYGRISEAGRTSPEETGRWLVDRLVAAIGRSAPPDAWMAPFAGPPGNDGAGEVADLLARIVPLAANNTPDGHEVAVPLRPPGQGRSAPSDYASPQGGRP